MEPVFSEDEVAAEVGRSKGRLSSDDDEILTSGDDLSDAELDLASQREIRFLNEAGASDESGSDLEDYQLWEKDADPPESYNCPAVSQTGIGLIRPVKLLSLLELLSEKGNISKSHKGYQDIVSGNREDKLKIDKLLEDWQKGNPATADNLEDQLTHEFITYAFVKYLLRRPEDDDDDLDEHEYYKPSTDAEWSFLSDFWCEIARGKNEIYKFFHRIKEHPSFSKYAPYLNSLSPTQTSSLVWDCSVRAQRVLLKLGNFHEEALAAVDKVISANREMAAITKSESDFLEGIIKSEAEKTIQNYATSEHTTNGRRLIAKGLCRPYLKSKDGLAAPSWTPYKLPFTFEQLHTAAYNQSDLDALQVAVFKSVMETKKARIEDRCYQLLNKASANTTQKVQQRVQIPGTIKVEVAVVCDTSTLIKWKEEMFEAVDKLTLPDVLADPNIQIDWLNVSAKMTLNRDRVWTVDECKRLWEVVVLPSMKVGSELRLCDIQRMMDLVKKYGNRQWDKVAMEMGSSYTPFQCFTAYECFILGEMDPARRQKLRLQEIEKGDSHFKKMIRLGSEYKPNATREQFTQWTCKVYDTWVQAPNTSLQTLAEHYNRSSNPVVQKGPFTFVEDLLLLVCITKMRNFLILEKTFLPLRDYLPWRFVANWACRANILFHQKTALWSRDEDLKLLEYAKTHKKFDWRVFSSTLGPDKNRKNTRGRYTRLLRRLQTESFDAVRKDFETKNLKRGRFSYTDFSKYVEKLQELLEEPQLETPKFEELRRNPSDAILWNYLRSFDKKIITETLHDLQELVSMYNAMLESEEQAAKCANALSSANDRPDEKPTDRRRFVRGDPDSTASAIHLRKLTLKPVEEMKNLSPFHLEVYRHFEKYKGKSVKRKTLCHRYLPDGSALINMTEIRDIIVHPAKQDEVEQPADTIDVDESGYPILPSSYVPPKTRPHDRRNRIGWKAAVKAREERRKKAEEDSKKTVQEEVPSTSHCTESA